MKNYIITQVSEFVRSKKITVSALSAEDAKHIGMDADWDNVPWAMDYDQFGREYYVERVSVPCPCPNCSLVSKEGK